MIPGIVAGGKSAPPPNAGLFDGVANVRSCYGLTRMLSSYSGPAIKIGRSSDSLLKDINYSGDSIDWAAFARFVGANTPYVHTLYDNSAPADHFVQATSTKMPGLNSPGSVAAELLFDGSNDVMSSTVNSAGGNASMSVVLRLRVPSITLTVDAVYDFADVFNHRGAQFWLYGPTLRWNLSTTGSGGFSGTDYEISEYAGALATGAVVAGGVFTPGAASGSRNQFYKDGSLVTRTSTSTSGPVGGNFPSATQSIGAQNSSSASPSIIAISRIVVFETDETANMAAHYASINA